MMREYDGELFEHNIKFQFPAQSIQPIAHTTNPYFPWLEI